MHKKIWNMILAVIFIVTGVLGIYFMETGKIDLIQPFSLGLKLFSSAMTSAVILILFLLGIYLLVYLIGNISVEYFEKEKLEKKWFTEEINNTMFELAKLFEQLFTNKS